MVEAEARGVEMWDAELNRVYQLLQKQLPQPDRKKLIDSQRAWLGFRDANRQIVRAVYERAEGTIYRPMAVNAELEIVKERAENLRRYLEIVNEAWPEQMRVSSYRRLCVVGSLGASRLPAAVYRKALFRDRNQAIKRRLFTLERRPDAPRGVFHSLDRRKFTLKA
jgi:Lysozyme inhibitor LprI